jgi:hypothetical protein
MNATTHRLTLLSCLLVALALPACDRGGAQTPGGGGDDDGDGDGDGITDDEAEGMINDALGLPPGSYTIDGDAEVDPSITVTPSGAPGDLYPDTGTTVGTTFSSPTANIVGSGIRFGDTGSINVVPFPGGAQQSGTASLTFTVPSSICSMLGNICHSISCYEFAVTDIGTVSTANITQIAMACGNCDEPTCQGLLMACEEPIDCDPECDPSTEACIDGTCMPLDATTSCALRDPSCCPGEDDSCTAPDSACFCDAFCTEAGDCCPDACDTCGFCG